MTQLLTLEKLKEVLKKYNLKEISECTLIPYNTLKNYSSGKTSLDSIPYRYLEKISEFVNAKVYEFLPVSNLIVKSEVFDELVSNCRLNFNPYVEFLHCIETINYRFDNLYSSSKKEFNVLYYFIDSDIFGDKKYEDALGYCLLDKLNIIIAMSLGVNVRIILRNNKDIYRNLFITSNALNLSEYNYKSIFNKLNLNYKEELSKLNEVSDKDFFRDLFKLHEYIKSLESLDDRVEEQLSSIDSVTVDIFK